MKNKLYIICLLAFLVAVFSCNKEPEPDPGPFWVEFPEFSIWLPVTPEQTEFEIPVRMTGIPRVFPGYINTRVLQSFTIGDSTYNTNAINNFHFRIDDPAVFFTGNNPESSLKFKVNYNNLVEQRLFTVLLGFENGPFNTAPDLQQRHFALNFYMAPPYNISDFEGLRKGTANSLWSGEDLELEFIALENNLMRVTGLYNHMIDRWGEHWTEGPNPVELEFSTRIPYNPAVIIPRRQYIGTTDHVKQYWIEHANDSPYYVLSRKFSIDAFITREDASQVVDHFRWESR